MKRLFFLILLLGLCLSGCGGNTESQAPATPRPVEYINIAEAQPLVEEFIASETFAALQNEFTRQINSKVQGPWLDWMIGFAMEDLGGEDVDYIVFHLSGDVATADGVIGEGLSVLYDRDTQSWHDSMNTNFGDWYTTFTGECKTREDSRNVMLTLDPGAEGSVIYHHHARERWLSKTDVAAINAALGLEKPMVRDEKGLIESVIETPTEERVSLVQAAAQAFLNDPRWAQMATDPLSMVLNHAMEYKNDDMNGQSAHVLLLSFDGVNPELHCPRILVEPATGSIYTENDLDMENWDDPHVLCLISYAPYLDGSNEDIWGSNEARAELTPAELEMVNAALAESVQAQTAERETRQQEAAAALEEGIQTELHQLAMIFQGTPGYITAAVDPGVIRLAAAAEYQAEDIEGYNVHALLLAFDGVDTDAHGFMASVALLDLDTNTFYTQNDLDMNFFGDFSCPEHALAAVMNGYESILHWGQEFIWSEEETLTPVSAEDIAAVNDALNP